MADGKQHLRRVLQGIGLVWVINLLFAGICLLMVHFKVDLFSIFVLLIGIVQWIYLTPILIVSRIKKRTGITQGIAIGGALFLLLNFTMCAGAIGWYDQVISWAS